jgi:hypothetical protein
MASTRKNRNAGSRKNRKDRKAGSRKGSRKASNWAQSVKRVYEELKRKDRNAKLGDAMREASRRRKRGEL